MGSEQDHFLQTQLGDMFLGVAMEARDKNLEGRIDSQTLSELRGSFGLSDEQAAGLAYLGEKRAQECVDELDVFLYGTTGRGFDD